MATDNYVFVFFTEQELDERFSINDSYLNFFDSISIDEKYNFDTVDHFARSILTVDNYFMLMLYYYYGLKQRLIAESFGLSQSAISQRIKRSKTKLKEEYNKNFL